MPDAAIPASDSGRGWSREEVDRLGTLRLLRRPSEWHEVTEAEEPDKEPARWVL